MLVRLVRAAKDRLGIPFTPVDEPGSILLVQLDHLGDSIISTVMLPLLRARYPHASIDILASTWNAEVFQACPEVDRVHVSRLNRFARRPRWSWLPATMWCAWRLRKERYDLAVDIRGEFPLALLIWLTGARRRLGWDCGGGGFLLTESPRFVPRRAEVDSRLALLAELDIHPPKREAFAGPRVEPDDSSRREVARRLAEVATPERPLFVVHATAGTTAKRWPIGSWQRLIERLIAVHDVQVAVVGGEEDRAIVAELTARFKADDVSNWAGSLRLTELAALLEQADLFVGADSGPAHLASAVRTPAIVLFSGTNDSRQWRPWGEQVAVVRHEVACSPCHRTECYWADHPCMRGLPVQNVMQQIELMWQASSRRRAAHWNDVASDSEVGWRSRSAPEQSMRLRERRGSIQ